MKLERNVQFVPKADWKLHWITDQPVSVSKREQKPGLEFPIEVLD